MKKPTILLDTDMDTDCDDAGALAILLSAVHYALSPQSGCFVANRCGQFQYVYEAEEKRIGWAKNDDHADRELRLCISNEDMTARPVTLLNTGI